ncbi:hypothetical protein [Yoonia sediminilitoris]|uniref:Uncharacterized protein n=1 Tax=Yoonia sediminilitoris TaxID=1286148 RepID=A0A2T6K8J2_9RHOB|nr:hypothetical protein [Yoonia sediminilitoris]PUB11064.1 hypothetical protein C8N45_11548 [Yoonia sediminilitoris]RCW90983.1 hypothetical protein DFP92_11548 [Yoonia sediminilitoris]
MMMPEQQTATLEEVLRMLARATPGQIKRLRDHIAQLPKSEMQRYDA